MNKLFVLSLLVFNLILTSHLLADDKNTGVIFGEHHAFTLTAPAGWVLDNQSGVKAGLFAVFYPQGSSWNYSPVVMYANTSLKEDRKAQQLIDQDVQTYKVDHQTKVIKDGDALITKDKKTTVVKYFFGSKKGNYDAVAYVDEKYLVVYLVMSARSQVQFDQALPAFKQLVASYDFITDESLDQYSIPPEILKRAQQDGDSPEGSKYESVMFPQGFGDQFAQMMADCTNGNKDMSPLKLVLKIAKDGTVVKVYGEKHSKIYDYLVPKLVLKPFTPPPHAPFYELMDIKLTP